MKRSWAIVVVVVLAMVLVGWKSKASQAQSQQAPPAAAQTATKEPSNQEINDAFAQKISKQIAGHEQEPSGQVFKNIQVDFLKKVPAGRLLLIMNQGYSRALGVNCKALSCGGRLLEGRQAAQALRARYGVDAFLDQSAAREDAEPGAESRRALY